MYRDYSQNAPMTGGNGNSGSGFDWQSALPGFMGGAGGLLGGLFGKHGADQYGNQIQNAQNESKDLYNQGLQYYQPYYDQGTDAFGKYGQAVDRMSDPTQFVNGIMDQYQESPGAQFQQQQGLMQANNASAASGSLGSPQEQIALQKYGQGVSNQDMQQYMQNALGVNSQYLSGLGNQSQMGFGAAQSMNQNRQGLADNLAELLQNLGLSQAQGSQAMGGGLGGLLGGLGSIFL